MPKYRIYHPRYVQQVGDDGPKYVFASPDEPAVIDLPEIDPATGEAYKVDRGLHSVDAPLIELKPHFAKPTYQGGQVKTAAEVHGKKQGRPSDKSPL